MKVLREAREGFGLIIATAESYEFPGTPDATFAIVLAVLLSRRGCYFQGGHACGGRPRTP